MDAKVLAFDIFGTVVDWRSGIARAAAPFLAALGRPDLHCHAFADEWRALYQPAIEQCRSGGRPYVRLDQLHRETLEQLLVAHDIDPGTVGEAPLHDMAHAWRRLDPWPDAVAGLTRLKAHRPIVTLSNANVALALEMARRAGLPWDAILGAEATGIYKPLPGSYLATADILGVAPGELCLVAAHHSDLAAARAAGLVTAFVARTQEYGGRPAPDAHLAQAWDHEVSSLTELADRFDR